MLSQNMSVGENGHLLIQGIDVADLAAKYGTPLYVMDENILRDTMREFFGAAKEYYGENTAIAYASKALCVGRIVKIAREEGLYLDCVSAGELYTALTAGFLPEKIYYHGNNKTDCELSYALSSGVARIVADNKEELLSISKIAGELQKTASVLLRIKPGVDAHTHEFIQTGGIDSKFGFALENGEAIEAVEFAVKTPNIEFIGIHCHIGSQIFDAEPFAVTADIMMGFASEIKEKYGAEVKELNLGGGFGIKYLESDDHRQYSLYVKEVSEVVKKICAEKNLRMPKVVYEPGRAIVGRAGITLYTVGSVKEIPGVRTYVSVDGGMTDNPRYALYGASYSADVATKMKNPRTKRVTIAGRCCESGDLIGKDFLIQEGAERGDLITVYSTGAYNYSMAMNYNRTPKPAMVFIRDGKDTLAVRRESIEDMARCDIF